MMLSRSSPKVIVSSSKRAICSSLQYLLESGTFYRLCKAFAATLAKSISSRFASLMTSINFVRH